MIAIETVVLLFPYTIAGPLASGNLVEMISSDSWENSGGGTKLTIPSYNATLRVSALGDCAPPRTAFSSCFAQTEETLNDAARDENANCKT